MADQDDKDHLVDYQWDDIRDGRAHKIDTTPLQQISAHKWNIVFIWLNESHRTTLSVWILMFSIEQTTFIK